VPFTVLCPLAAAPPVRPDSKAGDDHAYVVASGDVGMTEPAGAKVNGIVLQVLVVCDALNTGVISTTTVSVNDAPTQPLPDVGVTV